MNERWVVAVHTDGRYEVSDLGRVRRLVGGRGARAGRLLGERIHDGYVRVALGLADGRREVRVHRLVLESFVARPEWATEVNHKNGIRNDNRLDNLEWVTKLQNIRHAWATGLTQGRSGEANPRARLTWHDVRAIRAMDGVPTVAIAAQFGLSVGAIEGVRSGRHWQEKGGPR